MHQSMGGDERRVRKDERLYQADISDLLATLANCPTDARRVLLVGHNPGWEMVADALCGFDGPVKTADAILMYSAARTWDAAIAPERPWTFEERLVARSVDPKRARSG